MLIAASLCCGRIAAQELLFTHHGLHKDANLGADLEPMSDLDGDGIGEFLCAGADFVSLHSGKDGTVLHSTDHPDNIILLELAEVGDVNADGLSDYLVGDYSEATT